MLLRSGRNCHRYIRFINNRIQLIQTHKKDLPGLLQGIGAGLLTVGLLFAGITPSFAELPTGMQTVSGTATFQSDGNTLTINASNKAIINYQSFNIGAGNTVNIFSPLSLNRVTGGNPTNILGNLNSTGKVFLVNPSGIIFGQGSQVNVQGLVASTLQIKDDDFLAGKYSFQVNTPGLTAGSIINHGQLIASESVALLSGAIQNTGSIQAPVIRLAVGDQLTYFASPEVGIDVVVGQSLKNKIEGFQSAIANTGTISGQDISLQAKLAQAFYETTVNNEGIIKAQGLAVDAGGKIVTIGQSDDNQALIVNMGILSADGNSAHANGGQIHLEGDIAINTGSISAQSATNGIGGQVVMLGTTVQNSANAQINADGDLGGGTILVGGDYQGKNSLIRNALYNFSTDNVRMTANALQAGNGGKVILWADQKTVFQGQIEAKGAALGGNGGFVETSGKDVLQALGAVDARAVQGQNGQWLLDPNNITIRNTAPGQSTSTSGTSPLLIQSTDNDAIVLSGTIQNALNNGTNVTVQTASAGVNSQAGDITVSSGTIISKTSGGDATLTLKANNSIFMDTASITGSGSNKLNIILNSDTDQGTDSGAGGAIRLNNVFLTSNGGNITLGGGANALTTNATGTSANSEGVKISSSTLNAGAGNISIRGKGFSANNGNGQRGVMIETASVVENTTGNILINGTGGSGGNSNYGVMVDGNSGSTKITTASGNISVTGQGGDGTSDNRGVNIVNGGEISATTTGNVTVNATGGNGSNNNYGIFMDGITGLANNATISVANGILDVDAQGGLSNSSGSNIGLYMTNGALINSSGTGHATINATGGGGTNGNSGLLLDGYNTLTTISGHNGDLIVNGTGGNGTTDNNDGILLQNGGQILDTGTGHVTITGVAKGQTSDNIGIVVDNNNNVTRISRISGTSGDVSITGQGGGVSSNNNHGISVRNGAQIGSTGSANVTITGVQGALNSKSLDINNNTNLLGNNAMTGNLTLRGDDNTLNAKVRTAGKFIYQPYTDSLSVGLNGGTGTFQINSTDIYNLLDRTTVTPSAIVFGNANASSGLLTIGNNWNLSTLAVPAVEVYGGSILANSINMGTNRLLLMARAGDLTINSGSILSSGATGNAVVLAASNNVLNNAGDSAIDLTGGGRWLLYSSDPASAIPGFTTYTTRYSRTFTANVPSSIMESGNVVMYASNDPLAPVPTQSSTINHLIDSIKVPYLLSANQTPNTVLPSAIQTQEAYQAVNAPNLLQEVRPIIKGEQATSGLQKDQKVESHAKLLPEGLFPKLIAKRLSIKTNRKDYIHLMISK
jgi:filamentous hemagglutinin family protein